jgi:hypothetical protein
MTLEARIESVKAAMRDIVCDEVRSRGEPIVLKKAYDEDNTWDIEVQPNGTTVYDGCAKDKHGPLGTVEDLSLWELAMLLEVLEA